VIFLDLENYIKKKFPISSENKFTFYYYQSQIADAKNSYKNIFKYLNQKSKILEVGGGLHFLSNYLAYLNYNITSIEPGGFRREIDEMRKKFLQFKERKLVIKNINLEKYSKTDEKFDFIFSVNVLEHTKNIKNHLIKQSKLLRNSNSLCYIRCPNYSFPYESHFNLFHIPFLEKLTFNFFYKKKLINIYSKRIYLEMINSLNFNCSYFKIKKLGLNIKFINPSDEIFLRLETDLQFRRRIFSNKLIYFFYKIIKLLDLSKLINSKVFLCFFPYLVFIQKK
jgi:hypothetical protein